MGLQCLVGDEQYGLAIGDGLACRAIEHAKRHVGAKQDSQEGDAARAVGRDRHAGDVGEQNGREHANRIDGALAGDGTDRDQVKAIGIAGIRDARHG